MNGKTAIIVALPREVAALVNGWERREAAHRVFVWTRNNTVVACAGMGATRVSLACEAAMKTAGATKLISAGLAGACDPELRAGGVVCASVVIDAKTGERFDGGRVGGPIPLIPQERGMNGAQIRGGSVIVTGERIASVKEKARLRETYGASAVDMEAATVFRIAQAHGLQCRAIKAISDEADFALEGLERFVTHDGQFRETAFAAYAAIRPHLWGTVIGLGRNTARAVRALTETLRAEID